ncbi:hypothetical protein [Thermoanaerobacter kivui]
MNKYKEKFKILGDMNEFRVIFGFYICDIISNETVGGFNSLQNIRNFKTI